MLAALLLPDPNQVLHYGRKVGPVVYAAEGIVEFLVKQKELIVNLLIFGYRIVLNRLKRSHCFLCSRKIRMPTLFGPG